METKPLDGISILLVEDELQLHRLYSRRLSLAGARVVAAFNGREGLEKLKGETIDLILLDVMMPQVNGYEMLKLLKADPATSGIPVIVITNMNNRPYDI